VCAHPVNRRLIRVAAWRRRRGPDDNAPVARPVALDAGQLREHPFADRAERIVRKRIHLRILRTAKAFVFGITVPALPDGRRALLDLVAPGWIFAALQQARRQVRLTGRRQRGQQRPGTQKTRAHPALVSLDLLRQPRPGRRAQGLGQQVHIKRQRIGRLRIHRQRAVCLHILPVKGGLDLPQQRAVIRRRRSLADGLRHLRHQLCRVSEVGGVNIVNRRLLIHRQPITPLVAVRHPKKLPARGLAPGNKPRHRFPAPLDDSRVSIRLPNRPGTDYARIAPGRAEIPSMLKRIRRIARKHPARPLRFHQFPQPLAVKGRHVGVVSRRCDINLRVSRPAESLIALRAIRRQIEEIGALRPDDILKQPVHHGIGAFERAGQRGIRLEHNAGDRLEARLARVARQFHILEPVKSEARHIRLA